MNIYSYNNFNSAVIFFSWAVAGRNHAKLTGVLEQAAANTGRTDIKDADIIICDVKDQESLEAMAAKARVVLNCVGPYRFTGEQVSQSIFHFPTTQKPSVKAPSGVAR